MESKVYIELKGKNLKDDWNKLREKADEKIFHNDDLKINQKEESLSGLNFEVDEDTISFNSRDGILYLILTSEYGFVNVEIPLSEEVQLDVLDHLESKGEKIKRIMSLAQNGNH